MTQMQARDLDRRQKNYAERQIYASITKPQEI